VRVSDLGPFPLLDAAATLAGGREVMLAVVNRDRDRAHATEIELAHGRVAGEVARYEVNGAHPDVRNSFGEPHAVTVQESRLRPGARLEYTFPAHSLTVLRFALETP
jgi:alpha-L-arabinofuranosidase